MNDNSLPNTMDCTIPIVSNINISSKTTISNCPKYHIVQNMHGLNFLHLNAQSLYPKLSEITCVVMDLTINKTWLNASFADNEISIPGYTLFRKDRCTGSHGSVTLYIHSKHCPILIDSNFQTERVFATFKVKHESFIVGSLYTPPNAPASDYTDIMQDIDTIFSMGKTLC